jgi:hypothetical protein
MLTLMGLGMRSLAADLKAQGNAFYKEQKYREAIAVYSRAIG